MLVKSATLNSSFSLDILQCCIFSFEGEAIAAHFTVETYLDKNQFPYMLLPIFKR
jgi:hypothetical protein